VNLAIIQARYSSNRLPGKVLRELQGKPMLLQQIDRVKRANNIDKLVVATSVEESDNPIAELCETNNIEYFRGDLDDVLKRFYDCAAYYNATNLVRLTGDCPLLDPKIIDDTVSLHIKEQSDYTSNCLRLSYPDGQDVEVFTFEALKDAHQNAKKPSEREHVTPFIRNHKNYSKSNLMNGVDLSDYRMSVDHLVDFNFAELVYNELYELNPNFSLNDIINLLKNKPEIKSVNQDIEYNEGYMKSLKEDQEKGFK